MISIRADLLRSLDLLATMLVGLDLAIVMHYTEWRDTPSYRDTLWPNPRGVPISGSALY